MPLLKGVASKSTPNKAIGYIMRKDKAAYVSVQNLFADEDYAEQFKETAARYGKGKLRDERKYYHFKLSPNRKDKADPFMVQVYAKSYAEKAFPDCECVIATHTDTKTVHAHIIVNAVTRSQEENCGLRKADIPNSKIWRTRSEESSGFQYWISERKRKTNELPRKRILC